MEGGRRFGHFGCWRGNEFRNARASCIAGPCPFTRIEADQFSQGGQTITASAPDCSDPATLILAPTSCLPMLFPISPAEVPSMLSENASFAGFSIGQPMNNNDNDDLRQLAHILGDAYRNALMHDTPNEDLEAQDLRLESASIRLSSRLLYETTKGSCQSDEHAAIGTVADRTCVLDDESLGLRGLTDMLSYAAVDLRVWAGRFLPPIAQTASVLCSR